MKKQKKTGGGNGQLFMTLGSVWILLSWLKRADGGYLPYGMMALGVAWIVLGISQRRN